MDHINYPSLIALERVEATLNPKYVGHTAEELLKLFDSITISRRNEPFFTHQILCNNADNETIFTIRYGWNEKTCQWVYEVLL